MAHHRVVVREHHAKIPRIAVCTADGKLPTLPGLAQHFVSAEVHAFPLAERDRALVWLAESAREGGAAEAGA